MRHVFVDESCQNGHHYMVLGALVVPGHLVRTAEDAIAEMLSRHHMGPSELKWTKVSRAKAPAYHAFADFHFDWLCPQGGEFHSLIVDTHQLDHRTYNEGDPDLGMAKFLYSLLYHRVGLRFGFDERIVVDLDARNTARDPVELQVCLNRRMAKLKRTWGEPSFTRIAHRGSETSRLLQLADLLAGAVAWHKNDHDAADNASAAKAGLADHIAQRAGRRRLGADTFKRETRLAVWNHSLRKRGAR